MKQATIFRHFAILLFLLFSAQVFAQTATLRGTVRSGNTPLADASVRVGSSGTTTNTQGVFSISLNPGKYTLTVSYTGFEQQTRTVTLTASETTVIDFSLESTTA